MSQSKYVEYVKHSPNYNKRPGKILKITPHHAAGNISLEALGNMFAKEGESSANYGIDTNGRVAEYVPEDCRAWTSGNRDNDYQAITIEIANDGGAPDWHISDKAVDKLILLCVDICSRNGIRSLYFTGDPDGNITTHSMFEPTPCPGPYLISRLSEIADKVNKKLNGDIDNDEKYYIGPYSYNEYLSLIPTIGLDKEVYDSLGNVVYDQKYFTPYLIQNRKGTIVRKEPKLGSEITYIIKDVGMYTIVDQLGNWGKLKSGIGWIELDKTVKL